MTRVIASLTVPAGSTDSEGHAAILELA